MWDFTPGEPKPPAERKPPEPNTDLFPLPELPVPEDEARPVDPIREFDAAFAEPDPEPDPVEERDLPDWVIPADASAEPVVPGRSMDWGEPEAPPEKPLNLPPLFPRPPVVQQPVVEPEPLVVPEPEPEPEPPVEPEPESAYYAYESDFKHEPTPPAERFVSMLGELPATIVVFSPTGGVAEVQITGLDPEGRVVAYGPDEFMQDGLEITAELRDEGGSGFDITLQVAESYFQTGNRGLLHLVVTNVADRVGERESPRLPISEAAEAQIVYSVVLPERFVMAVRVADVSPRGIALLTEKVPAVGDTLSVDAIIAGRNVLLRARVTRIDPAAFGRYRLGCEITRIGAADREFLDEIASRAGSGGTKQQRRPDATEMLKESRGGGGLQERFGRGE